jgi:hypothetical protein
MFFKRRGYGGNTGPMWCMEQIRQEVNVRRCRTMADPQGLVDYPWPISRASVGK